MSNAEVSAEKTCSGCGLTKPISGFFRDSRSADGYRSDCKACNKAMGQAYAKANPEKVRASRAANYQKNAESRKAYVKEWRKNNPEKCRKYHAEYYARNEESERERQRLKSRNMPRDRKREIESRYLKKNPEKNRAKSHRRRSRVRNNGEWVILDREYRRLYRSACVACGSRENITADHVIPIILGGSHSIGNLQPMCMSCNTSKGSRLMIQFRKMRGELPSRLAA
jgi:5-methylcytosine-specific restriction endonuclease McrA